MSQSKLHHVLSRRPTAKQLTLSLLSQRDIETMSIGQLIAWGGLFNHEASAVRVTAARLVKQGLLDSSERGVYAMGSGGQVLRQAANRWRGANARVKRWNGGWLCAHTAHLGRSDKTALRARERAFRLSGFARLVPGLWCRPDNLTEDADKTFERLVELGLESSALLIEARKLAGDLESEIDTLWPQDEIERGYNDCILMMKTSRARLRAMAIEDAARESFLIGEYVIRQINADPLLPDKMIDAGRRREMVETMAAYNDFCAPVWMDFLAPLK